MLPSQQQLPAAKDCSTGDPEWGPFLCPGLLWSLHVKGGVNGQVNSVGGEEAAPPST